MFHALRTFGALVLLMMPAGADPFAFLRPTVTFTDRDRARLEAGEPIARMVPAGRRDVAMAAAVKTSVDGDRIVVWFREIEALKKSSFVAEIGRFSNPPRIEDLERMTLDETDLKDIRRCRAGDCGLKLSGLEIAQLDRALAGRPPSQHLAVAQKVFRQIVLERVQTHFHEGARKEPGPPPFFAANWPELTAQFVHNPGRLESSAETFLYWSKERLGRGKPIISVTQVAIVRARRSPSAPDPVVIGRQLFATHYTDASWSLTALAHAENGSKYLVYLNQSEVDLVTGFFGGLVRSGIQRQLRAQAGVQLRALKHRLEGGAPPARTGE